MSFKKSETQNEPEKEVYGLCSRCMSRQLNSVLINFGTTCESCFNAYCDAPSPYDLSYKKYEGDSKGWAKRIIDRYESGEKVRPISLKFAQQALKNKHEHGEY